MFRVLSGNIAIRIMAACLVNFVTVVPLHQQMGLLFVVSVQPDKRPSQARPSVSLVLLGLVLNQALFNANRAEREPTRKWALRHVQSVQASIGLDPSLHRVPCVLLAPLPLVSKAVCLVPLACTLLQVCLCVARVRREQHL